MFNSGLRTRVEELEKRVAELSDAYDRTVELEADWQDWLHKIRNVLARLNQRARAEEENGGPPRSEPAMNPAALKILGILKEG
jgi:hypothetical protein